MVKHLPFALLLLASSLAAQSLLPVPASHASLEGSSSTNIPFGRSTPTRVQYVYDGGLFAGPVTITQISFRLDGGAVASSKVVDCELRMSTCPLSLVNLAVDFASNRGADETVVLPRQLLTLPAQAVGATPSSFLPPIALPVSFAYDPLVGPLVLEIVVHGQPPGAFSLDVTYVCNSPEVAVGPVSCFGSNGLPLVAESATTQVIWGRPWIARVRDALPSSLVLLVLGTVDSGPSGGVVLPHDLQSIGAPGCFLSIDLAATYAAIGAADGSAVFPFAIPNAPQLLGEWIRYQGGALDLSANQLGLVTSQARKVQVCGWEPVARLWSNGVNQALGTREIGLSAVLRLTVQ